MKSLHYVFLFFCELNPFFWTSPCFQRPLLNLLMNPLVHNSLTKVHTHQHEPPCDCRSWDVINYSVILENKILLGLHICTIDFRYIIDWLRFFLLLKTGKVYYVLTTGRGIMVRFILNFYNFIILSRSHQLRTPNQRFILQKKNLKY